MFNFSYKLLIFTVKDKETGGSMKKKLMDKGFSLVELLAAIVVLGLLSTIAIIGVNSVTKNAEKKYYDSQENAILMAAQSYTQDNRNALPKTIGSKTKVKLDTLQERKYVGVIEDRQGNPCDNSSSYVEIFKYSQTGYSYTVKLVCDNYESDEKDNTKKVPGITLYYNDGAKKKITGNINKDSYKDPKINLEITKNVNDILSYSYIVYRCYDNVCKTELKNSGSIEALHQDKVGETISLKEYFP